MHRTRIFVLRLIISMKIVQAFCFLRMFRSFDDKNSSIDKEFKNSNLKIRQFQETLETFIDGNKQNNSSVFP